MKYDKNKFTYGFEMEMANVRRDLKIPEHLGAWEYSEYDICNDKEPYYGICVDPKGINPPVGGEVNTKPTVGWPRQVDRILDIVRFFEDNDSPPGMNCSIYDHIHIHVPGLTEDPESLKKLMAYIGDNQHDLVDYCDRFVDLPIMKETPAFRRWLKETGSKTFSPWQIKNIINKTTDLQSFIKAHAEYEGGKITTMPKRNAINTYCLKHINTVEFRCFRASLERKHLESMFKIVEQFIDCALNDGPPIREFLNDPSNDLELPDLHYDLKLGRCWEKTRKANVTKDPVKKRVYREAD